MFNENLKTLRKQKGFTQEELAIRVSVVRQTVSKWEKRVIGSGCRCIAKNSRSFGCRSK